MNHFLGLIIISLGIAAIFSLITKDHKDERIRYFLTLLAYMIAGSFIAAWLMSALS
ncbi:MAG: hypothetical protein ACRD1R_13695 [Acidobacteriota bacterium]